jgi:DNA-binding MarR family transcriptional regulator
MEDAGLVARGIHPEDSRVSVVSATDEGLQELDRWFEVLSAALTPHVAHLTDAQWEALRVTADALGARVRRQPELAR